MITQTKKPIDYSQRTVDFWGIENSLSYLNSAYKAFQTSLEYTLKDHPRKKDLLRMAKRIKKLEEDIIILKGEL